VSSVEDVFFGLVGDPLVGHPSESIR
jgi:hypothetical protein